MPTSAHIAQKQKPFINVTPLIDVLLVLLIIFMVVSPSQAGPLYRSDPLPETS